MHARKVKALMTSVSNLNAQVASLTEQTKSHAVAKSVQKVQKRLREQELVSDVLKDMVEAATGKTRAEVRQLAVLCCLSRVLSHA